MLPDTKQHDSRWRCQLTKSGVSAQNPRCWVDSVIANFRQIDETARPLLTVIPLDCRLCLLSRQKYTMEPRLGALGFCYVRYGNNKLRCLMLRATGMQQLNGVSTSSPLSGSLKLSQPI
jgi:hypothetical protein